MTGASSNRGWISLVVAGALLLGATGLMWVRIPPHPHFVPQGRLADMLPKSMLGWTAQDQPLGPTEWSSTAAVQTLKMDDYAYRTYRRGGDEVAVYVAYWRPGNSAADDVYRHTPDQCWPTAGLTPRGGASSIQRPFAACQLQPGEYRRFASPTGDINVWFWRLEGGGSSPLLPPEVSVSPGVLLRRGWVKLHTAILLGRKESVLVRISSNLAPGQVAQESLLTQIAESLVPTGLVVAGSLNAKS